MPRSKRMTPRRPAETSNRDLPAELPAELHGVFVEDWCPDPYDPDVVKLQDGSTPVPMIQQIVARRRFQTALWGWCQAHSDDPKAMWQRVRAHGAPRWRRHASQ